MHNAKGMGGVANGDYTRVPTGEADLGGLASLRIKSYQPGAQPNGDHVVEAVDRQYGPSPRTPLTPRSPAPRSPLTPRTPMTVVGSGLEKRGLAAARAKLVLAAVTAIACLAWMSSSSLAILVNKHIMVDLKWPFPCTIAWLGLLTTTIASYCALQVLVPLGKRHPVGMRFYLTHFLPTGFFMALTFLTGNTGYLYLTIAFVQILKAFCPVITMVLLIAARMEEATFPLVSAVTMIAMGVALASYGELNLSIYGLTAMIISIVAESIRLVLTQYLLVGTTFHPVEGLFYISSACTLWLAGLASLLEWPRLLSSPVLMSAPILHPWHFAAAALSGFAVNMLAILVIKLASSLTLKVLGTIKDACLVTIGVVFLHEQVSPLQLTGYSISLVGFVAYNIIKATPAPGQGPPGAPGGGSGTPVMKASMASISARGRP